MEEAHILAAGCLFNDKLKVTLAEIAVEWPEGTVVVAKKPNGQFHFIAGSCGKYYDIGTRVTMRDDQTHALKGIWEVVNEIQYTTSPEGLKAMYATPPVVGVNMVEKAAIAVFK